MVIIETSIFTLQVTKLLSDDEYREFQEMMVNRPDNGKLIRGSGGLRKIRWAAKGHGKSGGVRVIYYWATAHERLLMLFIYPKSVQDDLSSEQIRLLRKIVEDEYL